MNGASGVPSRLTVSVPRNSPDPLLSCTFMTKVQIRFRVPKPLDDAMLERLAKAHTLYGIQKVRVAPALDALTVEYDATRLRPAEVRSALAGAGIPVEAV